MNTPKVSIIILNWNGLKDTLECLKSVYAGDYDHYEVIVVDNGSTDGSPNEIKALFPKVVLLENGKNLGFAGGNNAGMRYALEKGCDYLWLLNNDTIVEIDTLSKIISTAEKDERIGLVSPLIYHFSNPAKVQFCGAYFDYDNFSVKHLGDISELTVLNQKDISLWGTALLIKSKIIDKVGILNEKYFAYAEDEEYSLRVLRAGFLNKMDYNARIFHKGHVAEEDIKSKIPAYIHFYSARNSYWMWRDNIPNRQFFKFIRKYGARVIRNAAFYQKAGFSEGASAALDGFYSAFFRIEQTWGKHAKMPMVIKRILFWHPYFFANSIELNFKNIFTEMQSRVFGKESKKYAESQRDRSNL